jgi:hypothetical protein
MTSPVAYWQVPGLEAKLAEVTAAGATVKEPAHDVGGGRLVATPTDSPTGRTAPRAEAKEDQTYCARLVRSSQATPTETAKAAPV